MYFRPGESWWLRAVLSNASHCVRLSAPSFEGVCAEEWRQEGVVTPSLRGAINPPPPSRLCDRRSPLCLAGQLAREEETAERQVIAHHQGTTSISTLTMGGGTGNIPKILPCSPV